MSGDMFLADRLYRSCCEALGAPERLQVAGLLRDADKAFLDAGAASALAGAVSDAPWDFESNLDAIPLPPRPLWFEWPAQEGAAGFLAAPNPDGQGLVTVVSAQDSGGRAVHPHAVSVFDLGGLYEHAWQARTRYSRVRDESLERIMASVAATLPPGLADELGVLEPDAGAAADAMRSATVATPFVFAVLVAWSSEGWFDKAEGPGGWTAGGLGEARRKPPLARLMDMVSPRASPRFSRRRRGGAVDVSWFRA